MDDRQHHGGVESPLLHQSAKMARMSGIESTSTPSRSLDLDLDLDLDPGVEAGGGTARRNYDASMSTVAVRECPAPSPLRS